ncbi:MAG: hypothetical protein KME37_09645 [Candidatus Thiodiazotropha sp. (ex Codakia orbicularis)]|nr:hypothetical protein [Candidatus Thiodiazotropha sp. (ex Codakia orbicularis)]
MVIRNIKALLCVLLLGVSAWTEAAEYTYLKNAVNDINRIYGKSSILSQEDRRQIFSISCGALKTLKEDVQFKKRTGKLYSDKSYDVKSIYSMLNDIEQLNKFVVKEYEVMKSEGYSSSAQINILSTSLARANGGLPLSDINADSVLSQISVLSRAICNATEEVRDTLRTTAVMHGMYGVALIAADGLAVYFSGSTLAYYAGVSGGMGGAMVMDAARRLNK